MISFIPERENKKISPDEEKRSALEDEVTRGSQEANTSQIKERLNEKTEQDCNGLENLEPEEVPSFWRKPERVRNKPVAFMINALTLICDEDEPRVNEVWKSTD